MNSDIANGMECPDPDNREPWDDAYAVHRLGQWNTGTCKTCTYYYQLAKKKYNGKPNPYFQTLKELWQEDHLVTPVIITAAIKELQACIDQIEKETNGI